MAVSLGVTRIIGDGTTKTKSVSVLYFFAHEEDEGRVSLRPLNSNNVPCGERTFISKDELLREYTPEPDLYLKAVVPAMRELSRSIARGESHRSRGQYNSAEYEYENALTIDEENVRATFGLGLTYIDWGDLEKAALVFDKLVAMDDAYRPEHKHLFNEFGISLRKSGMLDQAEAYYRRALQLCDVDEHLYFNIARACFEKRDFATCIDYLSRAFELNSDFDEAKKLMHAALEGKGDL